MSGRVVLYGRPGCHLCDVAREIIETVTAEADDDVEVDEINLWDDPEAADLYAERVPVVMVDGEIVAQFRLDPDALRAALGIAR